MSYDTISFNTKKLLVIQIKDIKACAFDIHSLAKSLSFAPNKITHIMQMLLIAYKNRIHLALLNSWQRL